MEFRTSRCAAIPWELFRPKIGLWQVLARQREIPKTDECVVAKDHRAICEELLRPTQLLDAAHTSLGRSYSLAATGKRTGRRMNIVDLLAGPPSEQLRRSTRPRWR